jgi:murein DD-endopeptidase MepM/ murein hydrolase activator NlpD
MHTMRLSWKKLKNPFPQLSRQYPREKSGSLFTIKKATSKRFFQLSFEGFRPHGNNAIEQFFNSCSEFLKTLLIYLLKKIGFLAFLISRILVIIFHIPNRIKVLLITKLIWSRGKLAKPIVTTIIMLAAFSVFSLGEIFSSSTLIVNQPVSADYLVSTNDIIPKKEIALTTLPDARKRSESFVYNVEPGDTLFSIGEKFKISTDALKYVNGLTDTSILRIGQEVIVPPTAGLVHKVESGDTLTSIAEKYEVPVQAIADFNYLLDTSRLALGTELVIPGGKVPKYVPPVVIMDTGFSSLGSAGQASPNKSLCVWPTTMRYISQYFSWYHNGVDIASPTGSSMPPLLSCMSGVVVRAGWDPWGLGLHVRIDHGNGYETVYGHMSRIDVSYGESVKRGEVIGLMGSTGRSTGPHVHFMVKYNGAPQDPFKFTQ